jgi:DNA-binding transcriptional LysR family regulator
VALTRFGATVFTEIRSLLKQARRVTDLADSPDELQGEVTIGIYQALAPYYLPAILARLHQKLPGIRVAYFEAALDRLVSRVHDGSADLSITYDVGLDPELAVTPLYSLRPFILAPTTHVLAKSCEARLRDLSGQPLVLLDQEASATYVLGLLHAHGVRPRSILRAQSFELQRSLVANGFGLALSHTRPLVATSYDGKRVASVPVTDRIVPQRVLLIASLRHRPSPAANAVAAESVELFNELPQAAMKAKA